MEEAAIPTAMFGMLQALPHTALWHRLEKEGRLLDHAKQDINQSTLMNFIPTRPIEDIASEYVEAFWTLYSPESYLERLYNCFLKLGPSPCQVPFKLPSLIDLKAVGIVIWRQGIKRPNRGQFWHHFLGILRHNPSVFSDYLTMCAHNEHFYFYREVVRQEIETQLAQFMVKKQQELAVK